MKRQLLGILLLTSPLFMHAQEEQKQDVGIKFKGFVKTDIFYDTRQTVSSREGHYLLFPAGESLDAENKDVNATPNFNFLSIQSRLTGAITGPDAFGAKSSGLLEADFFGNANGNFDDVNGFRLRHAFVKLNWEKSELLVGQFWHPMFVTSSFPDVVSFNTGAPFEPFSRNPQIKFTRKMGSFNIIAAAVAQRDFTSRGPAGTSSLYLRNAGIPELQAQLQWGKKNDEAGTEILAGGGAGYKMIVPQLITDKGYKTTESVGGLTALAFVKYKIPAVTVKLQGTYGENACDFLFLGGIGVKETTDTTKGYVTWSTINSYAGWLDIHTNGTKLQAGLFAGYTQNLGAKDELTGPVYALGSNIASIYRVAPRIIFNSGKTRFAGEIEYTSAAYGTPDANYQVKDTKDIANIRFLIGVYHFF